MVIIGPGPGDPNNREDARINQIHNIVDALRKDENGPMFYGICLGHQIICSELGLDVKRLPTPLQGVQKPVRVFDGTYKLGFYNTFCPKLKPGVTPEGFTVSEDANGFVFAMRGDRFGSLQPHPESVLSQDGCTVFEKELGRLLLAPKNSSRLKIAMP